MKIKRKSVFLLLTLLFLFFQGLAQADFYIGPGVGMCYTKVELGKLQSSYTSYLAFLDENFANDPYTADRNWDVTEVVPAYSFQLGVSGGLGMLGVSYLPHFLKQERYVMRESGYGRKFSWRERRHDILFDIGLGTKYIDVYGSIGVNLVNYKMVSSIVYPSGTESVTNEFDFNGVFRLFDAGYSLGGGIRIKPLRFLALDFRYIFSSDLLPGEKNSVIEDNVALADPSFARTPGTSQYPQDYTIPLSLENEIIPNFKRSYFQFTLHYFYRND